VAVIIINLVNIISVPCFSLVLLFTVVVLSVSCETDLRLECGFA
jgi:hypothetical protein